MLDELGNLQSEGHGIANFQTMLSIGLGQEQQFTLILQTLQQLRDVYGDSVDKIVQGNTSNIVFLKSTDDAMLDTLQKMSGTTHKAVKNSKTVTRDMERLMLQNEGKVTYTMQLVEVPTITYNDMAFISERNSIVFRAGDSPIWNRNETILPMSWRLFQNTIVQPGKEYSLQTIPTLSSALEFDVRNNQPNFIKMWEKRRDQANLVQMAKDAYANAYGYDDNDIDRLNQDNYADEIMEIINTYIAREKGELEPDYYEDMDDMDIDADTESLFADDYDDYEDNTEQMEATAEAQKQVAGDDKPRYAGNMLSREDLISRVSGVQRGMEQMIINAFKECRSFFYRDTKTFQERRGSIYSFDGTTLLIEKLDESDSYAEIRKASQDPNSKVYAEDDLDEFEAIGGYRISDAFFRWLVAQDDWKGFANGKFEEEMARQMRDNNTI